MKLLTKEIIKKLPRTRDTEGQEDPLIICKFFTPDSNWTWYVIEGDPIDTQGDVTTPENATDWYFYGLVDGFEKELGYFTLSEIQEARGPYGLAIERDMYFIPQPLSKYK